MHISVRYRPDLIGTIRLNLYLFRNSMWIGAAVGVLEMISGPAAWPDAAGLFYALGAAFIIRTPLQVLVVMYRHRHIVRQEAEITLTGEGIQRRTESYTLRVTWEMIERADELKHQWVFTTKRPIRRIALRKGKLSPEQQAELAAFIESRHLSKHVRKGMTPVQEAHYALTYGVARSDLKPEVQEEYDRLVAEHP